MDLKQTISTNIVTISQIQSHSSGSDPHPCDKNKGRKKLDTTSNSRLLVYLPNEDATCGVGHSAVKVRPGFRATAFVARSEPRTDPL